MVAQMKTVGLRVIELLCREPAITAEFIFRNGFVFLERSAAQFPRIHPDHAYARAYARACARSRLALAEKLPSYWKQPAVRHPIWCCLPADVDDDGLPPQKIDPASQRQLKHSFTRANEESFHRAQYRFGVLLALLLVLHVVLCAAYLVVRLYDGDENEEASNADARAYEGWNILFDTLWEQDVSETNGSVLFAAAVLFSPFFAFMLCLWRWSGAKFFTQLFLRCVSSSPESTHHVCPSPVSASARFLLLLAHCCFLPLLLFLALGDYLENTLPLFLALCLLILEWPASTSHMLNPTSETLNPHPNP
eukprot:TRINITY_DN2618_c0_g1_i1.p1 TRINITY_DN2618_c0_g1~~TRINITY_DN2618_c0_g1_i1.p1  ORF type:complete len:341 (+),score=82.98 TRINITY_DN2618_c0_g1_i1:105-1025(+)